MKKAGISSLRDLSDRSGVSEWQLARLQHGLLHRMPIEILVKLSPLLQVPVNDLLIEFFPQQNQIRDLAEQEASRQAEISTLKQEYARLQQQRVNERQTLEEEFQKSSLEVIESWLLQWPTAVALAQKNPQLSAVKLLAIVKPVLDLLKRWGVEAFCHVGEHIPYDPMYHQLLEGEANPGDMVTVRYVGYVQGSKLLYRAKVSPVKAPAGEAEGKPALVGEQV